MSLFFIKFDFFALQESQTNGASLYAGMQENQMFILVLQKFLFIYNNKEVGHAYNNSKLIMIGEGYKRYLQYTMNYNKRMNIMLFIKESLVLGLLLCLWNVHASEHQKAVIVVGYNNTRVYDVKKIRTYAAEYFGAKTILCKKSPTTADFTAADYVIDTGLEAKQEFADNVIKQCNDLHLTIIAVLPFSDQGTQLGAVIAQTLQLPGANPELVGAGLDKNLFRSFEASSENKPELYKPIVATRINSKEELQDLIAKTPSGLFIKPCQEGNNRGCLSVNSLEDCDYAWAMVEKYKAGGIMVEELISDAQEYSCDAIGSVTWLTLKDTSIYPSGGRGEIQYILPAPESENETARKLAAGRFMAELCGAFGGAYHNEIFVKQNTIMAVEPNLRPAGARIWDSAQMAFADFNPWVTWIRSRVGENIDNVKLTRNYYVGQRFIEAAHAGVIASLPELQTKIYGNSEVVELVWSKNVGDVVVTDITTNADYVGYILVRNKDNAAELNVTLKEITADLAQRISIIKN